MPTSRTAAAALLAAIATFAACTKRSAPETPSSPSGQRVGANTSASAASTAREACMDRALKTRGLNRFGDAADTLYPGGTPLFDERTGQSSDRIARIVARHPDIAAACPAEPSPSPPPTP